MTLKRAFLVGDWQVLPLEGRVVRDGHSERLRPKAMDILCLLAASPGAVVERDTILAAVWGRTAVTDEPLTATVGELRRVLGDRRGATAYIETIPKRGYRLLAAVTRTDGDQNTEPGAPLPGSPPPAGEEGRAAGRGALLRPLPWLMAGLVLLTVMGLLAWQTSRDHGMEVAAAAPRSLAVLPFRVLGGDDSDHYFGDGLAQEILTILAQAKDLRVAARRSAFEFRDSSRLADIRAALNVDAVLEGSIRREGAKLRIQAQLTDTSSGYLLWADTYDRTLDDAFLLQSDIAFAIADRLALTLGDRGQLLAGTHSTDSAAFLDYLRGRYLFETATDEAGLMEARHHLESALARDPELATARAALGGVWARLVDAGFLAPAEGYEQARHHTGLAIEAAPGLAEAHAIQGWIRLYHDWDWEGASESLGQALDLAPGDAFILSANAALNFHLAQLERAVLLGEMAVARDPLRASAFYNLAYFRYAAGDLTGAERALQQVDTLAPDYPRAGLLRVQIDLERGDLAAAASRIETHPLLSLMAQALVSEAQGDRPAALRALATMERDHAATSPYQIAEVYTWLGQTEQAFQWLDAAVRHRDPGIADLKIDRLLQPLHRDPRFDALLARVGLPVPGPETAKLPSTVLTERNP